jgi:hypothetical protein
MAARSKADKTAAILRERRIRLTSPPDRLHVGGVFAVVGATTDAFAPEPYRVERYREGDTLHETCTCPAGTRRVPLCSHVEAVREWMAVLPGWRG